jgi:hypothetical protein
MRPCECPQYVKGIAEALTNIDRWKVERDERQRSIDTEVAWLRAKLEQKFADFVVDPIEGHWSESFRGTEMILYIDSSKEPAISLEARAIVEVMAYAHHVAKLEIIDLKGEPFWEGERTPMLTTKLGIVRELDSIRYVAGYRNVDNVLIAP